MPVHDWTRVEAGIFHAFHTAWLGQIQAAFNEGLLPQGFYALAEQHMGHAIPDVLTLHTGSAAGGVSEGSPRFAGSGGTAVADAPPRVRWREVAPGSYAARRRTLSIRHVSGHRLVAMLEILSPANKDRMAAIDQFISKTIDAIDYGVNVLVVDLFPPGTCDPHGMHELIRHRLDLSEEPFPVPPDEPLTLVSYVAGKDIEVYREHISVGTVIPEMPLFLATDRYVNVPLESTYVQAYRGMPAYWRDVLEGRTENK